MRKFALIFIFLLLGPISTVTRSQSFPETVEAFDFTKTDGTIVNLTQYQDKPIVLDWTATWCTICEENLRVFRSLYDDFKDYANFITISYGDSGDTLEQVQSLENSKNHGWTFGLDHTNYAKMMNAANADVWIMDSELNLIYTWDEAFVTKADFSNKLREVIGVVTTVISSNDTLITSDIVIKTHENEISTFGLFENSLFLGFIVISVLFSSITIGLKFKNQ